jgi:hypothetical protein
MSKWSIGLTAMVGLLAAACGSDEASAPEAAPISVSGTVTEFTPPTGGEPAPPVPVAGAEVCLWQDDSVPCVTTDSEGKYTLSGVPANREVTLSIVKEGYYSMLRPRRTGTDDVTGMGNSLGSDGLVSLFAQIAGTTYPNPSQGVVSVAFYHSVEVDGGPVDVPYAGGAMTLSSGTGKGPSYVDEDQIPSTTLTETTSGGWGFFYEVEPGEIAISVTAGARSCTPRVAWVGAEANMFRAPVAGGFQTGIGIQCD